MPERNFKRIGLFLFLLTIATERLESGDRYQMVPALRLVKLGDSFAVLRSVVRSGILQQGQRLTKVLASAHLISIFECAQGQVIVFMGFFNWVSPVPPSAHTLLSSVSSVMLLSNRSSTNGLPSVPLIAARFC
jgi:hypothetical protein